MDIPDWADQEISTTFLALCARGESVDQEFMRSFPSNARELAKEIAAFATSGGGRILLGVEDDGSLAGLESANDAVARDQLQQRLEGICHGVVRPSITPRVAFAFVNEMVFLAITVPNGSEPVYYSNHIPYVRHLTQSRPAEPHEVIDLILRSRELRPQPEPNDPSPQSALLTDLAPILVDILIYSDEISDRLVNPWIDELRARFEYNAMQLRTIAIDEAASELGLRPAIEDLASKLDSIVRFRMTLGCGDSLRATVASAAEAAAALKVSAIDAAEPNTASDAGARNATIRAINQLKQLENRSADMIQNGEIGELQSEVSELGGLLLRVSYYQVSWLSDGERSELKTIARLLHLFETKRIRLDGGHSLNAVKDDLIALIDQLMTFAIAAGLLQEPSDQDLLA